MGSTDNLVLTLSTTELPFSYAPINLIDNVPHLDQLVFTRDFDIDSSFTVTIQDKRNLSVIDKTWVTLDSTTKTITGLSIPTDYQVVLESGEVYTLPDWWQNTGSLNEQTLTVKRQSPIEEPIVSWSAGSRLTANQLNLSTSQLLNLIQEIQSDLDNTVLLISDQGASGGPYLGGLLDMANFRIINLGSPVNDNDAASKIFVESNFLHKINDLGVPGGWVSLDGDLKIPAIYLPNLSDLGGQFFSQETQPSSDVPTGSVWVQLSTKNVYIFYDSNGDTTPEWTLVYSSSAPVVYNIATFFQTATPTNATYGGTIPFGSLWFNLSDAKFYRRVEDSNATDGAYWVDATGADGAPASQAAIVSTSEPASPTQGLLWHNPDTAKTFVYSSSTNGWVQT